MTTQQTISPLATGLAVLVSAYAVIAVLIGWGLGIDPLVRDGKTQTAMVPATAMAFILSAAALIGVSIGKWKLTQILTTALIAVICVTMMSQLFGWSGVTAMLIFDVSVTERMALVTALGFLLTAFAIYRLFVGDMITVNGIGIFCLSAAFGLSVLKLGTEMGLFDLVLIAGVSLQTCLLFCALFLILCLTTLDDADS